MTTNTPTRALHETRFRVMGTDAHIAIIGGDPHTLPRWRSTCP